MNVFKKVLLIDDNCSIQKAITRCIKVIMGSNVEVVVAGSLDEAERLYREHSDADFILMDTSLGEGTFTFELTSRISKEFTRPIISISSRSIYRQKMMEYGCTHECEKHMIMEFLQDFFEKWETSSCGSESQTA